MIRFLSSLRDMRRENERMLQKLVQELSAKVREQVTTNQRLECENHELRQQLEYALVDASLYKTNFRTMRDEVVRLRTKGGSS